MSTKEQKNTEAAQPAENKSSLQLVAILVMVVLVVIVAAFAITGNGNTEDGQDLAQIAPASSDSAGAADTATNIKMGNPTVALVNGHEIKRSDVFEFIESLPDQVRQMPIQTLFPLALEQVVNNHVINNKADNAKLETDPQVEQLLKEAKSQIVRNVYIDRQIEEAITDGKVKEAYDKLVSDIGDVQEVRARHILVETKETAVDIISQLDSGSDFVELAKTNSTGPSAERGGDLGYFAEKEMVPEFSSAAFQINKGEYSKEPVQTQFGWHIILVEDKRVRPAPNLEDVKPQLVQQLRQEILSDLLEGWHQEAKIELYDINGEKTVNN
jgi:peptidyl-prolyl cis-trans isomerase C